MKSRAISILLFLTVGVTEGAKPPVYLREHIYDTGVHSDEALVNVRISVNRWPDCTTLESAVRDIFRLEGVEDKSDQEKALALWKWFRILVSATGGSYAYEGPEERGRLCSDPHRIFTVYGHHQCDGLSWAMAALWRAAGYIAFDECTWGHTTAALRYLDDDGKMRFHSFDPQRRYYHWDPWNKRVSTRSMPVMRGMVFRHLTAPRHLHGLRTSLRTGETIERKWNNEGYIVPSGKDKAAAEGKSYYKYAPGKTNGVYAAVGEEVQTLTAPTSVADFARPLFEGSRNVACSAPESGKATLHPEARNQRAEFVYRVAPPYVVADAWCEATLLKTDPADTCRLLLSRDGESWKPIHVKENLREEKVRIDIGRAAWKDNRPNVYTAYDFLLKAEFQTANDVRSVGMNDLRIVVHRMLNKRTLPNLRPGENVVRVTADRIDPAWSLELEIDYSVNGKPQEESRLITRFPHYFKIEVPDVAEPVRGNYDQHFNDGALRMSSLRMRLQPRAEGRFPGASLGEAEGAAAFRQSYPHPAEMINRHNAERPERDVRETSGFFPQSDRALEDDERMNALVKNLHGTDAEQKWLAAEELGDYPEALDALLAALPKADIDLTLFLCKALAQIGDRKAIGPLLEKWKRAPRGAPGTRYIPDALAAIGDRSVVPALIAPLKECRFDYRFHVAHALGKLGGAEAKRALEDLAANDPYPAVRQEAAGALTVLEE